jgi:hypothetical protein
MAKSENFVAEGDMSCLVAFQTFTQDTGAPIRIG